MSTSLESRLIKKVPFVLRDRPPTSADYRFEPPYMWLDRETDIIYTLTDVTGTIASWTGGLLVSRRVVVVKCIADDTTLTVADALAKFTIPEELDGMDLVSVGAHVYTVSSSGLPTFEIYNLTDTVQMLTTEISIDATEKDSKDATTPAVINTTYDDVATGDELQFNCTIAGTGTTGMEIRMGFL